MGKHATPLPLPAANDVLRGVVLDRPRQGQCQWQSGHRLEARPVSPLQVCAQQRRGRHQPNRGGQLRPVVLPPRRTRPGPAVPPPPQRRQRWCHGQRQPPPEKRLIHIDPQFGKVIGMMLEECFGFETCPAGHPASHKSRSPPCEDADLICKDPDTCPGRSLPPSLNHHL